MADSGTNMTMSPDELIRAYARVQEKVKPSLPGVGPQPVKLSVETKRHSSAVAAMDEVRAFAPMAGWLGFRSMNLEVTGEGAPSMDDQTGELLVAELVNRDDLSLHVRYTGREWLVTTYEEKSNGDTYATDERSLLHRNGKGQLRYRRYWLLDEAEGARMAHCRLVEYNRTGSNEV